MPPRVLFLGPLRASGARVDDGATRLWAFAFLTRIRPRDGAGLAGLVAIWMFKPKPLPASSRASKYWRILESPPATTLRFADGSEGARARLGGVVRRLATQRVRASRSASASSGEDQNQPNRDGPKSLHVLPKVEGLWVHYLKSNERWVTFTPLLLREKM